MTPKPTFPVTSTRAGDENEYDLVRLEARPADNSAEWTRIFPSQLCWVAKQGHKVRAIELEIQANSSASEKVCDHPSTEKAASEAELVCAEAYQVVGTLLSDIGQFDTERGQKILDNLSEARMIHTDILPWPSIERAAPPDGQVIAHPANSHGNEPELKTAYASQPIFDAIAAATRIDDEPDGWPHIIIDAGRFIEIFNSHRDRKLCTSLVDPSLLGRETVREAAQIVFDTFSRDEAQGFRSRDRQYAISILGRALASLSPLKE